MEDQILQKLVDMYHKDNLSLHKVLRDPVFKSLPLKKRVEFIQNNSGLIRQGTKLDSEDAGDLARILGGLAFAGVSAAIRERAKNQGSVANAAIAASIGLGVGGALMESGKEFLAWKQKRNSNKYLGKIEKDPENLRTIVRLLSETGK